MDYNEIFPKVISHAKEYGFVFPSSEIYDGLGAVYDYGHNGAQLKKNIEDLWWKAMTGLHQNIVGLDAAILMHPKVWKASGHVDAFNDPLIDNKDSKKRYRADQLIEDYIEKLRQKAEKDAEKKAAKEGWISTDDAYISYLNNSRNAKKAEEAQQKYEAAINHHDLNSLKELIEEFGIADPETGSKNWTDVKQFNLMFSTKMGASEGSASDIYLRPETAQGIFVNFLNVQKTSRMKVPFGIAQIGKAFRNEIVARQFIFRMREFTQMEMQYFVRPGSQMEFYHYWKEQRMKWHHALGLKDENLQWHGHEKLAHYADAAEDIQFRFPFGFKELEGIHSRTDFDLRSHEELSGKKLRYFDPEVQENYIPFVIETSVGLDRTFLAHLCNAYTEEEVSSGDGKTDTRTVLRLHPALAPYKAAVFPLVRKDGLPEIAKEIMDDLKFDFQVFYEEKDTVGKRYRRHDAIGTPFCITVDYETKDDECVTIRERDSMDQQRIPIKEVRKYLLDRLDFRKIFQ